jgi:hypothetical protein
VERMQREFGDKVTSGLVLKDSTLYRKIVLKRMRSTCELQVLLSTCESTLVGAMHGCFTNSQILVTPYLTTYAQAFTSVELIQDQGSDPTDDKLWKLDSFRSGFKAKAK